MISARLRLSPPSFLLALLVLLCASCKASWSSSNATVIAALTGDGGFVRIEPAAFLMGAGHEEAARTGRQQPRRRVAITRAFEIGRCEVTQRQWQAVMGSNPSAFKGVELPVTNVSWNDVQEFLARLHTLDARRKYRLPTEAEWEMACRAGGAGETGGEALAEFAWFESNSLNRPHPVGRLKPNAWGLYDMQGNVGEWVQDWYDRDDYRTGAVENPQGPGAGQSKVHRGGGWQSKAAECGAAARGHSLPAERNHLTGFRLVRVSQL
jgi:formylglycine-generating enzyme required for sulfatase activity